MANGDSQVVVIRGQTSFAKVLGAPVYNKFTDSNEWSVDVVIDKNTQKELKQYGISDKVKTKDEYLDGRPYLSFRQSEFRKDGETKNNPITIKDISGKDWPQDKLIGNGSDVDVKFLVRDYGPGKKKGMYIRAIRVLNLVPYAGREEFAPISADDEFAVNLVDRIEPEAKASSKDVPFDNDLNDDFDEIL